MYSIQTCHSMYSIQTCHSGCYLKLVLDLFSSIYRQSTHFSWFEGWAQTTQVGEVTGDGEAGDSPFSPPPHLDETFWRNGEET